MKKIKKAKTKSKAAPRKQIKKAKIYPVYVLVVAIALLISGETALALNTHASDWSKGFALLDVSEEVSSMASDVAFVTQPTVDTVGVVNEFYNQAAIASTQLMGNSNLDSDPLMFVFGVNNFYKTASQELASVLDLSNYVPSWQPQVAGASISR